MRLQVVIQTLLMAGAGAVMYALGHATAALVVWSLAVFLTALFLVAPSIHATLDSLVARAASRVTSAIGLAILLVGGLLVGFGTRMAGGCTTGHGFSGCSRLQPGSLIATASFFGTAVGVSFLLEILAR